MCPLKTTENTKEIPSRDISDITNVNINIKDKEESIERGVQNSLSLGNRSVAKKCNSPGSLVVRGTMFKDEWLKPLSARSAIGCFVESEILGAWFEDRKFYDSSTRAIVFPIMVSYKGKPIGMVLFLHRQMVDLLPQLEEILRKVLPGVELRLKGRAASAPSILSTFRSQIALAALHEGLDIGSTGFTYECTKGAALTDFIEAIKEEHHVGKD